MAVPAKTFIPCLAISLAALSAAGQTIEINGQRVDTNAVSPRKPSQTQRNSPAQGGFGWGSNIQVARLARAAERELASGNYAAASSFAEQAVHVAPEALNLWLLLGYAGRLAGRLQTSMDAYSHALQLRPGSAEALSGLAQTYIKAGRTEEAKQLLLQVISGNTPRRSDLLVAGELFLQLGEYQRALSLLRRADASQPEARPELLMAAAYMRLQQPERAKQMLELARRHNANTKDVQRGFAAFYRDAKNFDAAIAALKAIPSKDPEILAELAWTCELAGYKREAATTYAQASHLRPGDLALELNAAAAWLRADDVEQANSFLDRAAKLEPNHYRLHALRAEIARSQSRNQDAIQEYMLALQNVPDGVQEGVLYPIQLRMDLAEVYQVTGNQAAAAEQTARAASQIAGLNLEGASRPGFLRLRATIKAVQGNVEGARSDFREALTLSPNDASILLPYGNLLWRLGMKEEARSAFLAVLKNDPRNRFALTSLGYLARDMRDNRTAENYFLRLASFYPADYVPHLALGDLYVATRQFPKAEAAYEAAYKLAPATPLVVAGGANNGIESHRLELSAKWLARATPAMNQDARVMRERERYLTWIGKYQEAAEIGSKVIQDLPHDRDAGVYLGYDLYYLGRYDEALKLVTRYEKIIPAEADFPLLAGYVHKRAGLLSEAAEDFTSAMRLDPSMVEAHVNRGYVLNDLQDAEQAADDFQKALKLNPHNGVAHLGIAFSYLELHRSKLALEHADLAQKLLGPSGSTHLARAGALRQQQLLSRAAQEYRAALKLMPDDLMVRLALADTLFHARRYNEAIAVYREALAASPDPPAIYAQIAQTYARLGQRNQTLAYVKAAEQTDTEQRSAVLLATGNALLTLGDRDHAMERFQAALNAADADRVQVRLALGELFLRQGRFDDARQQVSLGFAEARIGESLPPTSEDFTQAASLFLSMRDFGLATKLFERARQAGAGDQSVSIGLADTYLAQGETERAEAELAALGDPAAMEENYDYALAQANVYRQRGDVVQALSAFARASALSPDNDEQTERQELEVAGEEGLEVNRRFSVSADSSFAPIFEDATIYALDARLFGITDPNLLPKPRSSYENRSTAFYRVHVDGLPTITGFLQERNARGSISFPSESVILQRNTYDTNFNTALNPILRLGSARFTFTGGLQFTVRRDTRSAVELNQDLFRQFIYASSSPLFNWLSIRGALIHEAGPFTLRHLHSRDDAAHLDLRVGRPWGHTALVTGYAVRDLLFRPAIREYYATGSYLGLERKFGNRLTLTPVIQFLRSFRVQDRSFAIAQALRPSVKMEYQHNNHWSFSGAFALTRGQGFHAYDNFENNFLITYTKPWRHLGAGGETSIEYPLRLSVGLQSQSFYDFPGNTKTTLRPVVQLRLF